jgi:hypothetical protein
VTQNCFKIKNKSGTMSSHENGSAAAIENVTKRPHKSMTSEEKMDARRMEGGQSRPTVCRDLNMTPYTVRTVVKNADKIRGHINLYE